MGKQKNTPRTGQKSTKSFMEHIMTDERKTKDAANKVLKTFVPKLKSQLKPANYSVKMTEDFDEIPKWINPNPAHCFIRHNTDQFMMERSRFVVARALHDKTAVGAIIELDIQESAKRRIYCNGQGDMAPVEAVDDFSWAAYYVQNIGGRIRSFIDEVVPLISHALRNISGESINGNGDRDTLVKNIEALAEMAEEMAASVRDASTGTYTGPPKMAGSTIRTIA